MVPFDTSRLDVSRARYQYGWAWFDFHARQRMTVFNYFIIASSLVINAYATLIDNSHFLAAAIIAISGAAAAFGFLCLDIRNSQLVRWGEEVLRQSERNFLFAGLDEQNASLSGPAGLPGWHRPGILSQEDKKAGEDWHEDGNYQRLAGGQWTYRHSVLGSILISHAVWLPRMIGGAIVLFVALFLLAILKGSTSVAALIHAIC